MEKSLNNNKIISKKSGTVVSDKGDKTVVVSVESFKTHKKYGKKYKSTQRYKVCDDDNKYKVGDKVEIIDCRPVSKDKKYKVI